VARRSNRIAERNLAWPLDGVARSLGRDRADLAKKLVAYTLPTATTFILSAR
jgi:hypothetical protein